MKRIIVSLSLIISMVMCGGLFAQNNDTKVDKSQQKSDSIDIHKWTNAIERFVGVWSLEKSVVDEKGEVKIVYPGTFMIVNFDASYIIFVHTDVGAVITSRGNIIIDSPDVYIEVISLHVNSSLIGISNRIEYKLDPNYLHKSFWIEKDRKGGDYKREVNETWKRATMATEGTFENNPGFPI